MTEQQQSAEQLFGAALDHTPGDRRAFLDHACAGAPDLRQAVDELFLAHERAGSFLETPLLLAIAGRDSHATSETETNRHTAGIPSLAESRFEPGQVLAGRFTVVRFIARGGMGEVYEVDDRLLQGVHVALKAILPHIAADAGASRRFEQEVLLARKVTHPNLCPIYDIAHCPDTAPPCLFLTMKLLAGETLAARLRRPGAVPRDQAVSIIRQLTAGIAAIHDAGVIHGDIKPNNVMLDCSGHAMCLSIMDFGLARLHESENTGITRSLVAGTPGYLAPELLRGQRPTQTTDLFALGVLLHKLLTGESPECVTGSLSVEPSPLLPFADTPAPIARAVRDLLADAPDRRSAAFTALRDHLDARTSATPVTALDPPATPPVSPAILTRRRFAVAGAVTACAAVTGLAWQHDRVDNLFHPLPRKRFVALMSWPAPDPRLKPMLLNLIDTLGSELARAEAFDHDLYIIPHATSADLTTPKQLNDTRDALGANLVLATSITPSKNDLHLNFQVLDPNSPHPLRTRQLTIPADQQASLFTRSLHTAANLLDIHRFTPDDKRLALGTTNPEALTAFQAAEALVKQPNDAGLETALEKYKEAVDLDTRFALAYAKLATAYSRFFLLHRDPAALALAQANCETALSISPSLIEAHLALAEALDDGGSRLDALKETARALALDPANARALATHGYTLTRCNQWVEAEKVMHQLLRARPNSWRGRIQLGYLYSLVGRYADALMEFKTASLAIPKDALSLNNIAAVYLQQGMIAPAKQYAQKSLAIAENPSASMTLAAALRSEVNYKDAIHFAQQATVLDPSDPFNWLELADCCSAIPAQKDAAARAYRKVAEVQQESLAMDAADGPGWMVLALTRAKAGDSQGGFDLVRKADNSFADDLESQLYKVRTLELAGKRDLALSTVARCLSRGATVFQFATMPDLQAFRADERYRSLTSSRPLPA